MEGRVEDGHVRDVRQRAARALDLRQRRPVVERREVGESSELALDLVVDHDRLAEPLPAVDDPVRDRLDVAGRGRQRRHGDGRPIRLDQRKLQARRARVDD